MFCRIFRDMQEKHLRPLVGWMKKYPPEYIESSPSLMLENNIKTRI
jgi:hypothetical protein